MFPLSIRANILSLLIVFVFSFAYGQDRKITLQVNPGCHTCKVNINPLFYIRAQGETDTIHQLWDFTGVPTVLFAITGVNTSLQMTWHDSHPAAFFFDGSLDYSFAMAIDKVYEYDDLEDSGHIDDHIPKYERPLFNTMSWYLQKRAFTETEAMVKMQGTFMNGEKNTDILEIKLNFLPFKDYATELPHLIHTANSTLIDVSLVNMTKRATGFNATRYALHMIMVSLDDVRDYMHCIMKKSLDDEHTPGVFEIIEIKTPRSFNGGDGGFMQFRPVAYTERRRNVASSTLVHVSDFRKIPLPVYTTETLIRFYKQLDRDKVLVQEIDISMGEPGDGFYKQHNYTAWSLSMGYGTPPAESFSLFVVLIICIGLGVPVALALSGVVYVMVRRCKARNAPRRLVSDE